MQNTFGTLGGSTYERPSTLGEETPNEQLVVALDNLAMSQPRELFANRYSLLNEREVGGQAVVNFARDRCASSRCLPSLVSMWRPRAWSGDTCALLLQRGRLLPIRDQILPLAGGLRRRGGALRAPRTAPDAPAALCGQQQRERRRAQPQVRAPHRRGPCLCDGGLLHSVCAGGRRGARPAPLRS